MGNQNLSNSPLAGWELVSKEVGRQVYFNPKTGEEIEGFSYLINDEGQFTKEKIAFKFRLNNQFLVASKFFVEENERNMCSVSFKGKVFFESIPCRLSKIDQIPYPDILHVYQQAFNGFRELFMFAGYFDITQDLICINKQGIVKVWLSSSLEKIRPDISYGGLSLQSEMVDRAIKIIDKNTNHSTLPINILHEFMLSRPSTFDQALNILNQITLKTKTPIPSNLKSAQHMLTSSNEVYINGGYHSNIPRQQNIPAHQSAQLQQAITSHSFNKRLPTLYLPNSSLPDKQTSYVPTSITPTHTRPIVLPPRISTSKHVNNPSNPISVPHHFSYKLNNINIKQTISSEINKKGFSLDSTEPYIPGIYQSPPITSKNIKQVLNNNQFAPKTSNFALHPNPSIYPPHTSHLHTNHPTSNIYKTSQNSNMQGSQAGSFQFKSNHFHIKPRQLITHPTYNQSNRSAQPNNKNQYQQTIKPQQLLKTIPINNQSVNTQRNLNQTVQTNRQATNVKSTYHKPAQIFNPTNLSPSIQFKPSTMESHLSNHQNIIQKHPIPSYHNNNYLKQSNQLKIKNRTLSLQNASKDNIKQYTRTTQAFKQKSTIHEFKYHSNKLPGNINNSNLRNTLNSQSSNKEQKPAQNIQFHQHQNPNTTYSQLNQYKQTINLNRNSITKNQLHQIVTINNQSDRAHLKLNAVPSTNNNKELRGSNTNNNLQYVVRTPTNLNININDINNRFQSTAEKRRQQRIIKQNPRQMIYTQQSPQVKRINTNRLISSYNKQINRYSNNKQDMKQGQIISFVEPNRHLLSNTKPNKTINIYSDSKNNTNNMDANPYINRSNDRKRSMESQNSSNSGQKQQFYFSNQKFKGSKPMQNNNIQVEIQNKIIINPNIDDVFGQSPIRQMQESPQRNNQ